MTKAIEELAEQYAEEPQISQQETCKAYLEEVEATFRHDARKDDVSPKCGGEERVQWWLCERKCKTDKSRMI